MFFFFSLKYEYEFLEAKIVQQTSPEEAYRKFEEMGSKQIDTLRKLTKEVKIFFTNIYRKSSLFSRVLYLLQKIGRIFITRLNLICRMLLEMRWRSVI
jgi:hypothetical protein